MHTLNQQMDHDGYCLLQNVFTAAEIASIVEDLNRHLSQTDTAIRHREGAVYAMRNVLQLFPAALELWRKPELIEFLTQQLGDSCGLVRGLYFDKPPDQTWALPWHKDLMIAVKNEEIPSARYSRPRKRAGVSHTEPPVEVLERMLTLRIHLDAMTEENGPLTVLPGTHKSGKQLKILQGSAQRIFSERGDVFVMRPLLVHGSDRSKPDTFLHRRVLHLEFASQPTLPDGAEWFQFIPVVTQQQ